MTKEFNEIGTRQGDRRRMNMWALFIGVPLAFVLIAATYIVWS